MDDAFTSNLSSRVALAIMMHGPIYDMAKAVEELDTLRCRCCNLPELAPVWAALDAVAKPSPARRRGRIE
jgi:hypothetical protein